MIHNVDVEMDYMKIIQRYLFDIDIDINVNVDIV